MNSNFLLATASRAVSITTRNIFTKEYLGLAFLTEKRNESRNNAGKNIVKIKEKIMDSYKWEGIEGIRRQEILKFMDLAEDEKDMANLSRVVKDYLAHAGDPKHKRKLLCRCIETCYLRKDLKYSRLLSEGAFFQTFDQSPLAVLTHLQLLYDHGHYQEIVDKFKKLTKVKNTANMVIVMAALCKIGTQEAYKQAREFLADEFLNPKEVDSGRKFELFAWFSIQMGHFDAAIETLKRKKHKNINTNSKIRTNLILFALVKNGKIEDCLSEMANELRRHKKSSFIPVYSPELLGEIAKAVKHDEKLKEMYKDLLNDFEEKGKMDTATIEEMVFRPIDRSPHGISKEKAFNNPHFYVDPTRNRKFTKLKSKDSKS